MNVLLINNYPRERLFGRPINLAFTTQFSSFDDDLA